jgi:hypothetical protein
MKTLKRTIVLLAIMSFFVLQSFSQNTATSGTKKITQDQQTTTSATPGKFIDANKDGICDNHQAKVKNGKGANFVDKNGDGICDNCNTACKGKGNAKGCGINCKNPGMGKGNCNGNGPGKQCRHKCGNQTAPAADPQKPNDQK